MPGQAFEVAVDALRKEGAVWTDQSAQMAAVAGRASGLAMSGLQAGIFVSMVDAHNRVATKIGSMCTSASGAFKQIGQALGRAADTYEREDQNSAHEFRNLY